MCSNLGKVTSVPLQNTLRLILGDQLNENHDWFIQPDKKVTYVLMEIRQETNYVTHHIQKVAAFFCRQKTLFNGILLPLDAQAP